MFILKKDALYFTLIRIRTVRSTYRIHFSKVHIYLQIEISPHKPLGVVRRRLKEKIGFLRLIFFAKILPEFALDEAEKLMGTTRILELSWHFILYNVQAKMSPNRRTSQV